MNEECVYIVYNLYGMVILNAINNQVRMQVEVDGGWHKWSGWKRKSQK